MEGPIHDTVVETRKNCFHVFSAFLNNLTLQEIAIFA